VLRNDKHQNATTHRIHYGKEKQRRQNDGSKKTRSEGAGWERDGEESPRRSKDHEHLSARCRENNIRGRLATASFYRALNSSPAPAPKEPKMKDPVYKLIELTGTSTLSIEDAVGKKDRAHPLRRPASEAGNGRAGAGRGISLCPLGKR
jgi:hypothetical protein